MLRLPARDGVDDAGDRVVNRAFHPRLEQTVVMTPNTYNSDGTVNEFGHVVETHPIQALSVTLAEAILFWFVLANAYYRVVLYIAYGQRLPTSKV